MSIFNAMPTELNQHIRTFLDDRGVVAAAGTCRNWRENSEQERTPALIRLAWQSRMRAVHAEMIEREYPPQLRQALGSAGVRISRLPVLDLEGRANDYIDFLTSEDMTAPVMRFRDLHRRVGIAFHLSANPAFVRTPSLSRVLKQIEKKDFIPNEITLHAITAGITSHLPRPDECGYVLTIFPRHANDGNWTYAWGASNAHLSNQMDARHDRDHVGLRMAACPSCPSFHWSDGKRFVIPSILRGEDPDVHLAGQEPAQQPSTPPPTFDQKPARSATQYAEV